MFSHQNVAANSLIPVRATVYHWVRIHLGVPLILHLGWQSRRMQPGSLRWVFLGLKTHIELNWAVCTFRHLVLMLSVCITYQTCLTVTSFVKMMRTRRLILVIENPNLSYLISLYLRAPKIKNFTPSFNYFGVACWRTLYFDMLMPFFSYYTQKWNYKLFH